MIGHVNTAILNGIDVLMLSAEADVSDGLPCIDMVGFLSAEVRESKERIRTALKNKGISFPAKRITVNLAPANIKKTGSGLDLPIAVSILCALGIIEQEALMSSLIVGELHLDGSVSSVKGILPIVSHARDIGIKTCMVPAENVNEGRLIENIDIVGISDISDVMEYLSSGKTRGNRDEKAGIYSHSEEEPDFMEVRGQRALKRAVEIAVSGMHNFLMMGPPGAGKTMIARRIPSILPKLLEDEKLEVSKIYSVCGMLDESRLISVRPFRAPHHTISQAGLCGGGSSPRPGEISLAHKGVLFLDELPEFAPSTLEVLRQPLEEKRISITRAAYHVEYPADFLLVCAMNPCKCGYFPTSRCTCSRYAVDKYLSRVSKPLMDRIDLIVAADQIRYGELSTAGEEESSECIRKRVDRVQALENERFKEYGFHFNSQIPAKLMNEICIMDDAAKKYMERAYDSLSLTARGYHRMMRVARTIADMDDSIPIKKHHLMEAAAYRGNGRGAYGYQI